MTMIWMVAEGGGGSREGGRQPAATGAAGLPGYRVESLEWTEALVLGSVGDRWQGPEVRG